jgi:plastocyanin
LPGVLPIEYAVGDRVFRAIVGIVVCLGLAQAADIEGTVVIKRKLTRRKVTAAAGLYDRGPVVTLGSQGNEDPLAFERSHVAIYLDGELQPEPSDAVIQQENRQFIPDILVIAAGSRVSFPNLDPIFHNVFSLSSPRTFDLGNYAKGQTRVVTFHKPGIVFVNCRLHPNMTATIVVSPNRWGTIADGDGRFILRDVTPGAYTIVAWHKTAGFFRQKVEVARDRPANVQFFVPLPDEEVAVSHASMAER